MKITGIYQIKSLHNPNRLYIGSALNIHQRWHNHLSSLKNNTHHSKKLQNHFNKYGKSDLVFSVLICCDKEDLLSTEQYFLDIYKPYFNNLMIAGSLLGYKHTDDTKRKMRKPKSEIHKRKMSDAHRGKANPRVNPISEETRNKLRDIHKGKSPSEETRRKMSEAKKGKPSGNKGKKASCESSRKKSMSMRIYWRMRKSGCDPTRVIPLLNNEFICINQN